MSDVITLSKISDAVFIKLWMESVNGNGTFSDFLAKFEVEASHHSAADRKGAKNAGDPAAYLKRDMKATVKTVRNNLKELKFNLPKMNGESSRSKTSRANITGAELSFIAKDLGLPSYTAAEKKADKELRDRALNAQAARK